MDHSTMRRLSLIGILCFVVAFSQMNAQQSENFSLQEAIDYALQNSPKLVDSDIAIADAEAQIKETIAIGMPKITADATYTHFLDVPSSLIDARFFDPNAPDGSTAEVQFGTKNNLDGNLNFSALIFDAKYLKGVRAARDYKAFSLTQKKTVERQIADAVRKAYLQVYIVDINKTTLENNIKNLKQSLFEVEQMYKQGFVEQLDIDRIQLSSANLTAELDLLVDRQGLMKNLLKYEMGYPYDKNISLKEDLDELIEKSLNAQIGDDQFDIKSQPAYMEMNGALGLLTTKYEVEKLGKYPNLAAFANYNLSLQGDNLFKNANWLDASLLGLQLNVPIFDGNSRKAKMQRIILEQESMKSRMTQLEKKFIKQHR